MKMSNKKTNKRWIKIVRNSIILLIIIIGALVMFFNLSTKIVAPSITNLSILEKQRENPAKDFYKIDNCWLKKNDFGIWEMYLEGNPFEIGVINGKLTKELIKIQEDAFVEQINTLIPSKSYLRFLKYFIAWFNRDIDEYIPDEYIQEIYGVSFSASDGYDYIGNNYERMLNYHGAHDIGHALQSLALVGCTSFATNFNSNDSSMIIGRNFDFFINDSFAKNKIVAFVNPENGHDFVYVTWASMIGVVSGMNEKGITVTINAAKSDIPTKAKMPISLLAREILQYASNIEEAIDIARNRKTFVSESILIGSAHDHKAIIIEKSPSKIDIYSTDDEILICSNHFQSDLFKDDPNNSKYIAESASSYRQERCKQLLTTEDKIDYMKAADILRDYKGIGNENIGIGNEKTMAQFISHHSIIFQPEKLNIWVSTNNYQFDNYLMYNLNDVFYRAPIVTDTTTLYSFSTIIPADSKVIDSIITDLKEFRSMRAIINKHIDGKTQLQNEDEFISDFIAKNPEYYQGYVLIADYFISQNNKDKAREYYGLSLNKEFENSTTKTLVEDKYKELQQTN